MNKRKFTTHIASRKPVPIEMELQESAIELPVEYDQADLQFKKAKAIGICSLAQAKILSCDMEGDRRQWVRLEFEDETFLEWLNQTASTLIAALPEESSSSSSSTLSPRKTLLLSRFRKDYQGKEKVDIRLWKMDKEGVLQPYAGCLSPGMIVICSTVDMRAYRKELVNVVGDLHRDIVVVRKSNKKRRIIQYFSDSD
jgi:hypothetical protein